MNAAVRPIRLHAERALTFKAWRIPDDGQKRTKKFGVKLPIEGPRMPANVCETTPGGARTGRRYDAPAFPIALGDPETLQDALNAAVLAGGFHKDHIVIYEIDAGRNETTAHIYAVRQESQASYGGKHGLDRYHKHYPLHLFSMAMRGGEPFARGRIPPNPTHAEIIGIDPQLIEQGA